VDTSIDLGFETVVVGKNNIGKSSLVEIFDVIQRPHLTDFNIDMLRDIWRHRTDPENISKQSVLRLTVTFDWNTIDIEYWRYLSSLSKSGTTQLEIVYGIDSEVFDRLNTLTSIHELLPLLTARAVIGSINDIQGGTGRDVSKSFQHFLPRSQNIDNMSPDGYLLYNIKAFRQVDSFKEGNQTATAAQLSDELKAVLSDQQSILDEIQASVDKNLTPKLSGLKEDLSRFAYPKRDAEELSVILTIDEWLQKPQVRIAETYSDLKGFELGIPQQGLGYQNIYNIVARINRVFAELKKRDLNVPVLIVIEEPEAFTHPQLQHVFLQQITEYIHEKSDVIAQFIPSRLFK
jgi:predicted ATP-dependent endonuclease of OLD family